MTISMKKKCNADEHGKNCENGVRRKFRARKNIRDRKRKNFRERARKKNLATSKTFANAIAKKSRDFASP